MRKVLAALVLLLAVACRQETPDVPVNAEDVMFVQMMVRHHRQGIEIAKVGTSRATTPQLRTLAEAIESTQQDEVEMMLRWLHSWDQPLTAAAGAHDHHGGMPETDVKQIQALRRSDDFERDLLDLLIEHQGDAVRMASAEMSDGANPDVQKWAGQVRASRTAQIGMMRDLLKG
ncbi:DUF305 domain-containing protein [Nonomuraea diastatica]|uniref:DUF305 domain-containing protein n=1 Tax=Nonomuraea diastatica TaxID=1848329 RepID=A0A4R4WEA3_9ACTN|nr:DUF305 domain-containing protein [Nonomuraea diastatica]TDD15597.1 DUF305 domain-containing protein [Nonomuraea diastatica]